MDNRLYVYDRLQRLKCERTASFDQEPPSDCTSPNLVHSATFEYSNGESGRLPHVRTRARFEYENVYDGDELYVYANGSSRLLEIDKAVNDGSDYLKLFYDSEGRRIEETYTDLDGTVTPQRSFRYLPNGQLESVVNHRTNPTSGMFTQVYRYDAFGRVATIADDLHTYELYWDHLGRLLAADIDSGQTLWHFHYAGNTLVSATREQLVIGAELPTVKRFWFATDERGLVRRVLDEQGLTHFVAHWDAFGWRQLMGTPTNGIWVPFGLRGQLIGEGTEVMAAGVRPPIAISGVRAYDPHSGLFLQPDDADVTGRGSPEGYIFSLQNPIHVSDPSGRIFAVDEFLKRTYLGIPSYWDYRIDKSCANNGRAALMKTAIREAFWQILACRAGHCGLAGNAGSNFTRQWAAAVLTGTYYCAFYGDPAGDYPLNVNGFEFRVNGSPEEFFGDVNAGTGCAFVNDQVTPPGLICQDLRPTALRRKAAVRMSGKNLREDMRIFAQSDSSLPGFKPRGCLVWDMAHEALHTVYDTLPTSAVAKGAVYQNNVTTSVSGQDRLDSNWSTVREHTEINRYRNCFKCP